MVLLTFIIYIALFSLYSFEKTSESTTITELQYTIDGEEYINDNWQEDVVHENIDMNPHK